MQLTVIFYWNYGILDGSKGNKSIDFSALIRLIKTKFPTLVTSNTDECHGLGAFGTVRCSAVSGKSLPYVLQSKLFCVKMWAITSVTSVQNFIERAPQDEKLHHMEYVHPLRLLTLNLHSLRSETTFGIGKKARNI